LQSTVSISPAGASFPVTLLQASSGPEVFTVTNLGPAAVSISGVAVSGPDAADFAVSSNTCTGNSLPAGANCAVGVQFTPVAEGTLYASLTIADAATANPQTVELTATGSGLELSPQKLNFGSVDVGAYEGKVVTLTNIGTTDLSVKPIDEDGNDPEDFAELNTCGDPLPVGGACSILVFFLPTTTGLRTALLHIQNTNDPGVQNVTLVGAGK
jgi:hypothetical protein